MSPRLVLEMGQESGQGQEMELGLGQESGLVLVLEMGQEPGLVLVLVPRLAQHTHQKQ